MKAAMALFQIKSLREHAARVAPCVRVVSCGTAALALALLAACGGGGDDEERKDTQPVDCRVQPERCR